VLVYEDQTMSNNLQHESSQVEASYLSQVEAKEVMELWSRRQREEAARQSLVTIHDVAEATQLTPQEIQRLLAEVRSSKPVDGMVAPFTVRQTDVPFWPALAKVGPLSGFITLFVAFWLSVSGDPNPDTRLYIACVAWTLTMVVVYVCRIIIRALVVSQTKKLLLESVAEYTVTPLNRQGAGRP